ncbi:MAG: BamA/OMP85 family outer membrane protein [Armatimonadota bacterium]
MQMKAKVRIVIAGALVMLACMPAPAQEATPIIGEVVVEGNDFVAREPILDVVKEVLTVGEELTPTKAAEARRLVAEMGYFDEVNISVERLEEGVRVVITVVEKQRIEQVMFAGNTVISDQELQEAIVSQAGHIADDQTIARDMRRIGDYYESRGYIAKVPQGVVDDFGVLTFVIEEARLEEVRIEGLKRTKEFVVRRELDLEPGEIYQQKRVATNLRRLYATGLFEQKDGVRSEIRRGEENPTRDVILVIELKEAKTGRAAIAAGYSSLDDFVVMLSAAENNLRGQGERAQVSLEMGGRESYEVSFFEPYLDARGSTIEVNLFDTERRRQFVGSSALSIAENEFDERRTGGNFTLTSPITDRRSWSFGFRSVEVSSSFFQGTTILPPGVGGVSAGGVRSLQVGDSLPGYGDKTSVPDNPDLNPDTPEPGDLATPVRVAAPLHPGGRVNSVTLGLIDDTRDVRTNPSSGVYSSASYEQAGDFLGGSTDFGKLLAEHRRYLDAGGENILAVRVMAGTTVGSPPFYETFSVGGSNTLRGYEVDRWRGERLALVNVEYRKPLTEALTAVGFVDAGSAWGGTFPTVVPGFRIKADDQDFTPHVGGGVGLRVDTPIGPIRLDMGVGEDGTQAHFSFGHTF